MSQPTTPSAPNGIWRSYSLAEGLGGIHVEHLAQDADGYLWITSSDSGVSRFDGDEFRIFTAANGLSGNQVFAAYRDSQDRLWFGSRDGGVTVRGAGSVRTAGGGEASACWVALGRV